MGSISVETLDTTSLPFDEAVKFFGQKTNVPTKTWTDLWQEAHVKAFSVAGATSDALLTDFKTSLTEALAQGTTLEQFKRDFNTIVQKHGWEHTGKPARRAAIIYETNLGMAFSAGRYAQMTDPVNRAVFPCWTYRHSGAAHPRKQHLGWDGTTLENTNSFWITNYPPNGWNCRCWVDPTMRADLRRAGKSGPDPTPPIDMQPKVLKDGRTVMTPAGVDPGFGYNPGQAWLEPVPRTQGPRFRADPIAPPPPALRSGPEPIPGYTIDPETGEILPGDG